MPRAFVALAFACFGCVSLGQMPSEALAQRVIVLANRDDPDSLRVARHYLAARDVPAANLIALKLPLTETITWRDFVSLLWQPLIERLVREKWLDAIPMALTDAVGRQKYAPNGHRIAALVVCRGVPLKIAHDPALAADSLPFTQRGELRTNAGAVDAELSLLPAPNYNINAFVPNPLFQLEQPADTERHIVRVGRLDGPTADDAMRLVDQAIAGERTGLLGRAYIDIGDRDAMGNAWLESAARQLNELGFDTDVDRAPATIAASARFDAPALYFGWYAGEVNGPFTLPGFKFPPGAIAVHVHSYSAATMRSTSSGWAAPFVARGVTATVGNVNEPYLEFTHRPDLLLKALARGATLGEAAYFALSVLSWQGVLIGDPLYRPFAVSVDAQLECDDLPREFRGYAVLRQMRLLAAAGRPDAARDLARRSLRETPNLALALAVARGADVSSDREAAMSALGRMAASNTLRPDEWTLAAESARLLERAGQVQNAIAVWRALLPAKTLPPILRVAWLGEARDTAKGADDFGQAARWEAELTELAAAAGEK